MRITAQAKQQTRERILKAARELFREQGFAGTTTRQVAARAGIAAGTLFNYFPSKEALALHLLGAGHAAALEAFRGRRVGEESLAEDLFAQIAAWLRELEDQRPAVAQMVDGSLSLLAPRAPADAEHDLHALQSQVVRELVGEHLPAHELSALDLHLYWTLLVGVLAHWSRDDSPHQEDTLALLDRSCRLFVAAIDPAHETHDEH